MNEYLAYQLNGIYAQTIADETLRNINAIDNIINYIGNISLDNAGEKELEAIGLIIGFPRPIKPNGFSDRLFRFSAASDAPQYDAMTGFGSVHTQDGGYFDTVHEINTDKLPLDIYRIILKKIAYIKYNGLSIVSIDYLMSSFDIGYTFSWNEHEDIVITFLETATNEIIWLCNKMFEIFCTAPQILIINP